MEKSVAIQRVGFDDVSDRALYLLAVDSVGEIPKHILLNSSYFVTLVVWDARGVPSSEVASLARILLDSGCVYYCCWGPGCERVHDIIDEEYTRDAVSVHDNDSTIMTTWHDDEPLEEAAWFSINVAFPDDRFFDECKAVLALCIGNASWAEQLSGALCDPRALVSRVVYGGGDAA